LFIIRKLISYIETRGKTNITGEERENDEEIEKVMMKNK